MDITNFLIIVAGFIKAKRWDDLKEFYLLFREVIAASVKQDQEKLDAIYQIVQNSKAKLDSVLG